jgi:DNA-binding NarL/FixJ family response regulator
MAVSVLLADDNLIVRTGIRQLLVASDDGIDVVGECNDLHSLLEAVERDRPDVIVTDIRMPPTFTDEGIQVAALLRERGSNIGVVVLSSFAEPDFAVGLLESGLEGRAYILKERVSDRGQLVSAIQTVAAGGSLMDPKVVEPLVLARTRESHSALSELSPRELEVLAEIAQGKSNAAIADSLFLTKRAVEKHINAIFMKLNLAFADDISKRVKATLVFLSEFDRPSRPLGPPRAR